MKQVVISILGGVAYLEVVPRDVEVVLADMDNEPSLDLDGIKAKAIRLNGTVGEGTDEKG